jgi:hypothetical protein
MFKYVGTSYADVNAEASTFVPELTMKPTNDKLTQATIDAACQASGSFSSRCEYDYRITSSMALATSTGQELLDASSTQTTLNSASSGFCSMADIPYSVKSYSNGVAVGSTLRVTGCINGYTANNVPLPLVYSCSNVGSSTTWSPPISTDVCVAVTTTSAAASTSTATFVVSTTTSRVTSASETAPSVEPAADTIIIVVTVVAVVAALSAIVFLCYKAKANKSVADFDPKADLEAGTEPPALEMQRKSEAAPQPYEDSQSIGRPNSAANNQPTVEKESEIDQHPEQDKQSVGRAKSAISGDGKQAAKAENDGIERQESNIDNDNGLTEISN